MAGVWSGGGTVTLDDGSTERIRCRATYAVGDGGNGLNQSLTCASDSYKFDLTSNVIAERRIALRNMERKQPGRQRQPEGRGGNGNFQVDRQRARIYREYFIDHARQPAVRRDQVREPVQGRVDFAVALAKPCLPIGSIASASPIGRPFLSWFWRSAAPAPC